MTDEQAKLTGKDGRGDSELRSWLNNYIREHPQHTTIVLSRVAYIGISRKALDAYLAGTYFLPKEEGGMGASPADSRIESAIAAFHDRVERGQRATLAGRFLETRTWKQMERACSAAILENRIVLVYGLCCRQHKPDYVAFTVMWRRLSTHWKTVVTLGLHAT